MSQASILAPVTITPAMLVSTTVPETATLWTAGPTFAVGARVRGPNTNRIYESQLAGNVGKNPENILNRAGLTIWWVDIEATNRWKVFDNRVSSQTAIAGPMTYVFRPGLFNALYLAGLDATGLSVSIKDAPGGTVVFTETSNLEGSAPADYYEFFYDRFKPRRDYLISGLAPYTDPEVTVTLTGTNVLCGLISVGDLRPIGESLYGASVKPKTSSYIKINDYLEAEIVKRKAAKDLDFTARLSQAEANTVIQTLTEYLDIPCLVVAAEGEDYEGLRAYGLISSKVTSDNFAQATLTLSVNGLI